MFETAACELSSKDEKDKSTHRLSGGCMWKAIVDTQRARRDHRRHLPVSMDGRVVLSLLQARAGLPAPLEHIPAGRGDSSLLRHRRLPVLGRWTVGKPTMRTYEVACLYLQGWADHEELLAQLKKTQAQSRLSPLLTRA